MQEVSSLVILLQEYFLDVLSAVNTPKLIWRFYLVLGTLKLSIQYKRVNVTNIRI